jgi:hypothetical protein
MKIENSIQYPELVAVLMEIGHLIRSRYGANEDWEYKPVYRTVCRANIED